MHACRQNTAHKRAIAASLIKGAYILERDRQKRRTEHEALAPPWWESFNFELVRALKDTKDGSYYGAIYKYKSPYKEDQSCLISQDQPPKYVIAFRGTLIKRKTFLRDLKLDILVIFHGIHHSTRFKTALEEVGCMVDEAIMERIDANTVWLVGHSLGASIALAVGKEIVINKGYHLQTYLFNSPFSAIPFDAFIKDETLKATLRLAKSGVATAVSSVAAHFFGTKKTQSNDLKKLMGWVPNVFVNRDDFICAEYIGFFKIREGFYKMGAPSAANMLSKQLSLTAVFSLFSGRDQKPSYFVHSAYVTLNSSTTSSVEEFSLERIKLAHQLSQWWSSDIVCETELHKYNPDEETDD